MAVPIDIAVTDYTQSVGPKTSQANLSGVSCPELYI